MQSPESQPSRAAVLFSIVASALWIGACLVVLRLAWTAEMAKADGLAIELLAAAPLLAWASVLWRGVPIAMGRRECVALFICAVALRLILIGSPPAQSDDAYRYLWEGRVQKAGENPYRLAPEAPELSHLRDENWALINHPEYSAIYPPLSQAAFLAAAFVRPSIVTVKIFFTLCDLGVLAVLLLWLRRLGRNPAWALLWAFHPVVIVEFSGNGHLDSLMILMTLLALWLLDEEREIGASIALAGAVAAKLVPLLLLPYFFWRMRRWWWLGLVPVLVAASYLPYAGAGEGLFRSLWVYQRDWIYNSPVFDLARDHLFGTDGWLARYWFYGALVLVAGVFWIRKAGPAAAYLPVMGFYQIAGPVVHPWYLAQFVPFMAVRRGGWPWVWLTATVPLIYLDEQSVLLRWVIWAPFFLALAIEGLQSFMARRARARGDDPTWTD